MTTITRRNLLIGGLGGTTALTLGATLLSFGQGAQAQELTVDDVLFDPANPVLGNPDGDVTLVEFFDYQCPYCKANHKDLTEAVAADGNVRLVMKDWPIFGAPSIRASQLVLGAASAGEYEKAHDAVMTTDGRLTEDDINAALKKAGLDPEELDAAYRSERSKWDGLMARNSSQATQLGLQGTPAFIIGTTIYPGAMDRAALDEAIAASRA